MTTSLPPSPFPLASLEGIVAVYETCKFHKNHWKNVAKSFEKLEEKIGIGHREEFVDASRGSDMLENARGMRSISDMLSGGKSSPRQQRDNETPSPLSNGNGWRASPVPMYGELVPSGRISPEMIASTAPESGSRMRVLRNPGRLKNLLKFLTLCLIIMYGRMIVNGVRREKNLTMRREEELASAARAGVARDETEDEVEDEGSDDDDGSDVARADNLDLDDKEEL